jgi:hypothetical protein
VKRILVLAAAGLLATNVQAQDRDADLIVLPDDAQKCVLPASPDAIPEDATLDQLKEAKAQIAVFQGKVEEFRGCLSAAEEDPDNTPGNSQAIVESFNYSVEMEERVAQRFNDAVRSYKERKAAAEG